MSHRANAALYLLRISDAAQCSRHHVAMLESGDERRPLVRVVSKPVQKLGKSPLRRIDAATPLDSLQALAVSGLGDLGSLSYGAMVAPEVILAEWLKIFSHRNHGRPRGIERDGLHLIPCDAGVLQGLACCRSQCPHVIVMGLGGVFGVFALAVQRIFGDGGFEQAAFTIDERNANAERSEIDSRHDGHQQAPSRPW